MPQTSRKVALVVSWMAGITSGLVALGLPLVYLALSYYYQEAVLDTEADINARMITQIINANPEMWRYEDLRLTDLLSRRPFNDIAEARTIRDLNGVVVAESNDSIKPPYHSHSAPLLDSGRTVGTLVIDRSLRPILNRTALLALLGMLLGLAVFYILKVVPLRTLQQALDSLYEEKERAQVTLRSIGDGVITTDEDANILMLNAAAEKLTGWRQQGARGRPLHEVFVVVDEETRAPFDSPVERVVREGKVIELSNHTVLIARDGAERVVESSAAPIRSESGNILGAVLVFRDSTEKRKLEAERLKAGKLESLGLLAGGIAHDFNNILTAVMGNISLVRMIQGREADSQDRLAIAEQACLRAKDLTSQLLTFARGGSPVKETVSLGELIRTSSAFALTGSNVRPVIRIADDLPPVNVDPCQINQVLHNLIINASQAMPEGGIVTIRADQVCLGKHNPLGLAEGGYIRISVADRGAGIPKDLHQKIFDPYFTTKQGGTGLGLATCYSIVKRHDGHITVESEPGKGALFEFHLPASSAAAGGIKLPNAADLVRGRGRILIMDDEEIIREFVGEMLKGLGYEVAAAADGAEAIAQYRKARESGAPFDAVIMDLTVPGGMGGKETIQKLRELDGGIRAIVSSGYADNEVMSEFRKYGFLAAISKPYTSQEMSRVLYGVLQNGNQPGTPAS